MNKSKGKKETGIMGLKFMQKAEQRKQEALKLQAEMAIKQINGEDDYVSSEEDDQFVDAKKKFGVKKLAAKNQVAQ